MLTSSSDDDDDDNDDYGDNEDGEYDVFDGKQCLPLLLWPKQPQLTVQHTSWSPVGLVCHSSVQSDLERP